MVNKLFLFITALVYGYLGSWALFFPESFSEQVGLTINTDVGSGEIRSVYGGINLLVGLYSFLAIVKSKNEELFFKILLFSISGILLGRIVTAFFGEFSSIFLLYFTIFEIIYLVFLLVALKKFQRKIF